MPTPNTGSSISGRQIKTVFAEDTYPLVEDVDLLGSFRVVATISARNAIPAERRKEGMLVAVVASGIIYSLNHDLSGWTTSGFLGGLSGNNGATHIGVSAGITLQQYIDERLYSLTDFSGVDVTTKWQNAFASGESFYIPQGNFTLTAGASYTAPGQTVYGLGRGISNITLSGNFNLFSGTALEGISARDFTINGSGHTGGHIFNLFGTGGAGTGGVGRFIAEKLIVNGCYQLASITRSNRVTFRDVYQSGALGAYIINWFGDDNHRCDLLQFFDLTLGGDPGVNPVGLICDGFVNSLIGLRLSCNNVSRAMLLQNTVGSTHVPTLGRIVNFACDNPLNEVLRATDGSEFEFTMSYFNGAGDADNIYLGANTNKFNFIGGKTSGAWQRGIYDAGTDNGVDDMRISANSVAGSGLFPEVQLASTSLNFHMPSARMAVGNALIGIQIDSGADGYCIGDDILFGNVPPTPILNNATASQTGKVGLLGNMGYFSSTLAQRDSLANAGMEVWQRGAGGSAVLSVSGGGHGYGPDRWVLTPGAGNDSTLNQVAGIAPGSTYACKIQRTAGQVGVAAAQFEQDFDLATITRFVGKIMSVSIVAKAGANFSPTNGKVTWRICCGTGAAGRRGATAYTSETIITSASGNNLTTTATPISITSTQVVPSNTTQMCVQAFWTATGTAGADDSWTVDNIQFDIGTAQPFYAIPFEQDLLRCRRTYRKSFPYSIAPAQNTASTLGAAFYITGTGLTGTVGRDVVFDVPMKLNAAQSITTFNPSAANANWRDTTNSADRVATTSNASEDGFSVTAAGTVAGAQHYIHWTADSDFT